MGQTRLLSKSRNPLRNRCLSLAVLPAIILCGCGPREAGQTPAEAQDRAAEKTHVFSCDDGQSLRMRFLGPETIEVIAGDSTYVLQRTPTASGARYASADAEFWNKGEEALFAAGGLRTSCLKSVE